MLRVKLLTQRDVEARLSVCWGHLPNWKTRTVVKDTRAWTLQRLSDLKEFCYIVYESERQAGFIEFLPIKSVQKFGLNPCRVSPMAAIEAEYRDKQLGHVPYPDPTFTDDVFISCLWVQLPFSGKGIGKALVGRLFEDLNEGRILSNERVKGVQVYIEKRRPDWHPSIDWPAGSIGFYEKMGFYKAREVKSKDMIGCVMRRLLS